MLWNLIHDKKIKLHTHKEQIGSFLFCGKGMKYIISIDLSQSPNILFSDWTAMIKLKNKNTPKKPSESLNTLGIYIEKRKTVIFIENFKEKNLSRMIVAEIKNENFAILQMETLQEIDDCLAVHYFDWKRNIELVTIEKFCIKIWKFFNDQVVLDMRIHSKEEISDSYLNTERNILYFVTSQKDLNLMNQDVNNYFSNGESI